MYSDFVKKNYTSQADKTKFNGMVEYGYGQVEPNHLSAQRTGQIYAQLPANANIDVLEQGQFVKYDYAASNGGEVNFTGLGEWMLVYNEIKLYRDIQQDCEFAMVKDNYQARIYSPYDWEQPEAKKQAVFLNGKDASGNTSITLGAKPATYKEATAYVANTKYYSDQNGTKEVTIADADAFAAHQGTLYVVDQEAVAGNTYKFDDVTGPVDPYEIHYNEDPMHFLGNYKARKMPADTTMVPRVFKTNVGDIFTTNMVKEKFDTLALGAILTPGVSDGILTTTGASNANMQWQVVRKYTLADNQPAVKIMRIK